MKTRIFRGGIKIEEYKGFTEHKPIEPLAPLSKLNISLKQNIGALLQPVVEICLEVTTGELIAAPSGAASSTLHASVSGKEIAVTFHPHPYRFRRSGNSNPDQLRRRATDGES